MADDPTQQLEGIAAQAPGQLGQALQNQQNQPAPAAPAAPDPVADGLDQAAQHYSQQLQENATRPAQGGAIKRLLSNFIGGMGQSMMQEAGLPTPYEKQQQAIQGLAGVAAAKSHLATVQSLQAQSAPVPLIGIDDQPVTGSDGKPIMLPANHAATIYAARIAAQSRENVAETNLEGPTLTPEQANAMGHPEMAGQGLNKALAGIIQNQAGKMPVTQDMLSRYNLPPESLGKMVKMTDILSAERLQMQGTRTTSGGTWKETSPGEWTFLPTTSTTVRGAGTPGNPSPGAANHPLDAPGVPHQLKTFAGGGSIYAYNPKTNETVLTTPAEQIANGYTNPRKVTQPEIDKDRQLSNRLTDVATKLTRYESTMQAPLSVSDRAGISAVLSEDKFALGAFHTELPIDWLNQLTKSGAFNHVSPEGQKRLISYFNARESMQGYQRVLSGSGHSSDTGMQLNLDALANPLLDPSPAKESIHQFKENIPIAAQGLPRLPGVTNAADVLKANDTVRVQIPGQQPGTISRGRLADFQKKYPTAQVLQ